MQRKNILPACSLFEKNNTSDIWIYHIVSGTYGTLMTTPKNTLIVAGQNATMRCSTSTNNLNFIGWVQGVQNVALGCPPTNYLAGYATICQSNYNELYILQPTAAYSYRCSDTSTPAAKAAFVILGKYWCFC